MKSNYKLFQGLNILGFIGMVLINFLANYLPINNLDTGYISDLYPNLFTPAGFTFSIWGLIYLLLGIFVVYQAKNILEKKPEELMFVNRIGYLFFSSCVLNATWIFAWHYLQVGLSLVIMLLLLANLILLYNRLIPTDSTGEGKINSLVKPAFSIYTGWITIATVANFTAFLVDMGWGGFGLSETFWMILITMVATVIVLVFMQTNRDWIYSLVALWAFLGIISQRLASEPVETAVIVVVVICMVIIAANIYRVITNSKPSPA